MRALVTGAAGFIGSHLAERLLREGHEVVAIDCFTPFYQRSIKEGNLRGLRMHPHFTFIEGNVLTLDLRTIVADITHIFHLAAQAGVRSSWGKDFDDYTAYNILATQRLLEACTHAKIERFVYSSSSSVYGDAAVLPLSEHNLPLPVSPYGVTKLAAEHLCHTYAYNYAIPIVSLRYFTVYGPRQRPDMAFHRFMKSMLDGEEVEIFGDGTQTRDFTYVTDAVEANLLAASCAASGMVVNIGGGSQVSLREVLDTIQEIAQRRARIKFLPGRRGDMQHTLADTTRAKRELGYQPQVALQTGIKAQWEWMNTFYR